MGAELTDLLSVMDRLEVKVAVGWENEEAQEGLMMLQEPPGSVRVTPEGGRPSTLAMVSSGVTATE